MPLYAFVCAACGPFELWRPADDPAAACPACAAPARRVFTAPGVALLPAALRGARDREERSGFAPEVVSAPVGRPLPFGGGHAGHGH